MMELYAPSGRLESLDITGSRIILQRIDSPLVRLAPYRNSALIWTLERDGYDGEQFLLMLKNSSIWDAEKKWELVYNNQEFTVIDANGICFQTTTLTNDSGKDTTKIVAANGQEYFVDSYYGFQTNAPMIEALGERAMTVVRDTTGDRWFSKKYLLHNLELVDQSGKVVLSVGDVPRLARIWSIFGARNFGPRLSVIVKKADETIPNEVAVFLGIMILQN